jgi:hypothetical protein
VAGRMRILPLLIPTIAIAHSLAQSAPGRSGTLGSMKHTYLNQVVFACATARGEQKAQARPAVTAKQERPQEPPLGPQQLASIAVDKFIGGMKLADLPEGRAAMIKAQWVTGDADYGESVYYRPVYTEGKTLFEGLFDTDVATVRGYKRLMEMDAVSEAKTTLKIRFVAIAYADKASGEWKVLTTGDNGSVDVESNLTYFRKHLTDTRFESEQGNYYSYGFWLLQAGQLKAAKEALLRAKDANPLSTSNPNRSIGSSVQLKGAQISALLDVINRVIGN